METKELLEAIGKMMDEKLDNRLKPIQEDLSQLSNRMTRVEVLLEHDLPKQIQTLAEGHNVILERIPEADEIDTLRNRVRTLERVVTSHSQEIDELKQAN